MIYELQIYTDIRQIYYITSQNKFRYWTNKFIKNDSENWNFIIPIPNKQAEIMFGFINEQHIKVVIPDKAGHF